MYACENVLNELRKTVEVCKYFHFAPFYYTCAGVFYVHISLVLFFPVKLYIFILNFHILYICTHNQNNFLGNFLMFFFQPFSFYIKCI